MEGPIFGFLSFLVRLNFLERHIFFRLVMVNAFSQNARDWWLQEEFSLATVACSGARLWVYLKHLEAILIATDGRSIKPYKVKD